MADLPTNYLDDILSDSMGGKRRYKITHLNGTSEEVTIEDISKYDQVGSTFGAGDINKTNQAVNEKFDSDDVVDPKLATEEGFSADAKLTGDALSELNKNIEKTIPFVGDNIEELSTSTTSYTATNNGWLYANGQSSGTAQSAITLTLENGFALREQLVGASGLALHVGIPLKKGQTVTIGKVGVSITAIKFFY